MSQPVQWGGDFSRWLLLSLLLHGGISLLLSLKPRVVTLIGGPENGILQATLVTVATDNVSTARPLRSEPKSPRIEQPPPQVEQPPRMAEKTPVKIQISAKESPEIVPSKKGKLDQLGNTTAATPRPSKQAPATSAKKGKLPAVKEKKATRSPPKSDSRALPAAASQTDAVDLDHFFGHLAASSASGGLPSTSAQQYGQYINQIKSAIQANWIKDPGSQGRGCEIALQLAADGTIMRAQARQGDPRVCAAALRAVGITERVPKPANPVLYDLFKEIVISFEL